MTVTVLSATRGLQFSRAVAFWAFLVPSIVLAASPRHAIGIDGPGAAEDVRKLLDSVVPRQMERWHSPGAVVVIVKGNSILFSKGYGLADVEAAKPVDPAATLFHVASVSKPVTATAIMQLVEQGKLELNRNVNEYLPPPGVPTTFPQPITLAALLTHTSGLDDRFLPARQVGNASDYLRYNLPDRLVAPGAFVRYSNHNFVLAGWLIEAATGERFEKYMARHVLTPLHMHHSTFGTPGSSADCAAGYQWRWGRLVRLPAYVNPGNPAASLLSTGEDLANFMIAHLNGGACGGERILSAASIERMHHRQFTIDPRLQGSCYGFWEHNVNGIPAVAHNGSAPGFKSNLVLVPHERLGMFAAVNGDDGFPVLMAIENALFDHWFPAEPAATQHAVETTVPEDELRQIAGTYRGNNYHSRTFGKVVLILAGGGETRFEAEGGHLMAVSGAQRVALRRIEPRLYFDPEMRRTILFSGTGPAEYAIADAYVMERLRPDQTLAFQLAWLGACLLIMISPFLVWPAAAMFRRLRRANSSGPTFTIERWATWSAAAACACYLLFVLPIALLMLGFIRADIMLALGSVPTWLKAMLALPVAAVALTLIVAICTTLIWRRGSWAWPARLHYTLVAASLVAAAVWFNNWNLLGWRY